jgi:hypothetical protein
MKIEFLVLGITIGHVFGTATTASAEVYLFGGIQFPHRSEVTERIGPSHYSVPPSGQTIGWVVGGGTYLGENRLALDFSWAQTGVMQAVQPNAFSTSTTLELREHFLSLGIRGRLPLGSHISAEPVGSFLFTIGEHWFQQSGGFPRLKDTTTRPGVGFGADVRIGSSRVAVAPGLHFAFTAKHEGSVYPGGSTRLAVVPRGSVQFNF